MSAGLWLLCGTAASIGLVHTLVGVDHTLPLVALGRASNWSRLKLAWVTVGVGAAHVGSSVLLGAVGLWLGSAVGSLVNIESTRGPLAANLMVGFGVLYAAWAMGRYWRGQAHAHPHVHADGTTHDHVHTHDPEHLHLHDAKSPVTLWSLFLIFGLGPCEPLIPLLIVPGLEHGVLGSALVAGVFALVTIATMLTLVLGGSALARRLPSFGLAPHADALAGIAVAISGLLVLHAGL